MNLLSVNTISKHFGHASGPAVDGVSFELREGGSLGLVGESGSGKSTTARCVVGLERPDLGSVLLAGRDVATANRTELRAIRRDVQMVFQDPYSSLNPRMTVGDLIAEGLIVHGIEPNRGKRRARVAELLDLVGLPAADADRYPRSFSGGQRQRIAIARALAVGPKLLVCDEPVSSLDVSVQAQVLNLLRDLRERLGIAILFIAHDLAVVRYVCDDVAVMSNGRIVEMGSRDAVFDTPQDPYTRALLAAVPVPDPVLQRERQRRARSEFETERTAS